jgi:hypothetical protein
MTATTIPPDEAGISDEGIALAGVPDAMRWRDVLEQHEKKRLWPSIVIYPRSLSKFGSILSTPNVGMDDLPELCSLCEGILIE